MIQGFEEFNSLMCYPFIFAVALVTFIVMKFTPKGIKFTYGVPVVCGGILLCVWKFIYVEHEVNENLYLSFLAACALHPNIISFFQSKFKK
jgi:hypothetical protein